MALPVSNSLQAVQTYQKSGLALLSNSIVFLKNANMKFKDFQNFTGNLGDTVTFDKPPKALVGDSLVADFQGVQQRVQSLTVDKAKNVSYAITNQQQLFNIQPNDYMPVFVKSGVRTLATIIESDLAQNAITHTYRFYGGTSNPLNSFTALAQALARFRNYGAAPDMTKCFIPDLAEPNIVGTGLNQFATNRNNDLANSWEIGNFSDCDFFRSNLLATHRAGTLGNDGTTLTVVSISSDGTQITLSGAGTDNSAVKEGDLFEFQDVDAARTVRYLNWTNGGDTQLVSGNPVQVRATADAASSAGNVTISITPALISDTSNLNVNIDKEIVAGMQILGVGDHKAGLIYSGDAFYVAMPKLPDEDPFATASETDDETGASLRMYYGSRFGMNQRSYVIDQIWGSTLVDEYAMRLVFPI